MPLPLHMQQRPQPQVGSPAQITPRPSVGGGRRGARTPGGGDGRTPGGSMSSPGPLSLIAQTSPVAQPAPAKVSVSSSPAVLVAAPRQQATPDRPVRRAGPGMASNSLRDLRPQLQSQPPQARSQVQFQPQPMAPRTPRNGDTGGVNQEGERMSKEFFDRDGDGVVDMAELKAGLASIGPSKQQPPLCTSPGAGQSLGLPPTSQPLAPSSSPSLVVSCPSPGASSPYRLRREEAMAARVAASAGGGPPTLPPRLRKLLAGGAAALNTGGRTKSWLQTGTHRTGNLGGDVHVYCMLLPSDDNAASASPSGPFTLADVANMIYSAEVMDGTPVWAAGMGGWQRCGDCVARFSWPSPNVDDRSPLAGGRVPSPEHVHERLSPQARDRGPEPEPEPVPKPEPTAYCERFI